MIADAHRDLWTASDCLRALFRGDESLEADTGGLLLAEALTRLSLSTLKVGA